MLEIGKKIKELRKAQDVTQEKLAEYLNISYQAISKWENGLALPDITLLPKLANFFGVTTDALLNMDTSDHQIELQKFEEEYYKLNRKGKVLERIELSRKVLDLYPRNYQWMLNLAYSLISYNATSEQIQYSQDHKFIEEAILLCERILEDCAIDGIRHGAVQILCYNYPQIGKEDEAIKLAGKMPDLYTCRESLLCHIYTGEKCLKQNQSNLMQMIDLCAGTLYAMAYREDWRQDLTIEDKIKHLEAAIKLYQTILDGDENSLFYHCRLTDYYLMLAKLYCKKENRDTAVKYLLLSEKSAKVYDRISQLGEQQYRSVFLDHLTWSPKKVSRNHDSTAQEALLYNLDHPAFVDLKGTDVFQNLRNRLKESL